MSDLTGQTIGPYRLVDKLGEGGMATVYKAYHPRLDRYLALKCFHPQLVAAPGFLQRFEREAKILARLSHANIVHLYDFGEADGHCYLAMEYGAGGTLKDRQQALQAAGTHMGLDEVQRVLLQVSAALDYAHRHDILHRDIKPSTILLTRDGRALLSDFGLSRMLDTPSDLTSLGAMIGTPAYLSPEQGRGAIASIGLPSDVYALGVVLYELLTGRVPFTAETPLAVVLKQLNDPIPSARVLNPALPAALEPVLRTALAKDPAARYQRAGELAQAFQGAATVTAPSPPAAVRHQSVPVDAASPLSAQATALTMTAPLVDVTSRRARAAEQPATFGADAILGLTTADAGPATNDHKTDGATLVAGRSSLVDSYSRLVLDELERANLLLIPLDDERTWYRYHALFGELLKNQLLQAEPERVDDLHERAADWYQNNGFIQNYFARQERFAETHELVGWLIEIWIVRALMYQVEGKAQDAHHMIQAALNASVQIGQQLFLSLNTVQFHIKNIYGKLSVNRRVQAIEKAREKKLI